MPSDQKGSARWPGGDQQSLIQRAAALRAKAHSATSPEARVEFEQLALQYQRMAVRVARRDLHRSTLGELLYRNKAKDRLSEADWIALVRAVGLQNQHAFQTLYLWTHRVVFALIKAITRDSFATEQAAVDVFYQVWQDAGRFDAFDDTVIGWIMNKARARSLLADPITNDSTASVDSTPDLLAIWEQIAERITPQLHDTPLLRMIAAEREVGWEQPAAAIFCKILSRDTRRDRVSMLVRLAPDGEYPPHMHAGLEQLHLLEGELWINSRKLLPGDYNCSEPGSADERVWSATGCTCVLITSSRDILN